MHPFMQASGITDKKQFYSKYPDQETFFKDYPHMQNGGMLIEQNQALPEDYTVKNSFRNVSEMRRGGQKRPSQIPMQPSNSGFGDVPNTLMSTGGPYTPNNNYTNANGIYSYQQGGFNPFGFMHPQQMQNPGNFNPADTNYTGSVPQQQALDQVACMKDGGIHIKKANVGKFTEYKKRTGKTTEEALHSKDPHVRQMANFSRNAKKWKHQEGGEIMPYEMQVGGQPNQGEDQQQAFMQFVQQMVQQHPEIKKAVQQDDPKIMKELQQAFQQQMQQSQQQPQQGQQGMQVGGLYHNQTEPNYGAFTPDGIRVAQEGGLYHNQTNPNYGTYTPDGVRVAQFGGYYMQPGGYPDPNDKSAGSFKYNSNTYTNSFTNPTTGQWQLPQIPNKPLYTPTDNNTSMNSFQDHTGANMSMQDMSKQADPNQPRSLQGMKDYMNTPEVDPNGITGVGTEVDKGRKRSNWPAYVGAGIGAGIGAGLTGMAIVARNKQQQGINANNISRGMTTSQYPQTNPMNSKGDYGTVGQSYGQNLQHFSYGNTGNFQQPIVQNGGMQYAQYHNGGEYDLDPNEISRLQKLGYKIQYI